MTLTDPVARLRAHAPGDLTEDHVETLLESTWRAIEREDPAAPGARPSRRTRRIALGAAAFLTAAAAGGITVAAADPAHERITSFLSGLFSPSDARYPSTPDPGSARMVFSMPGPDGLELQGWTIASEEGGLCTSDLFEPRGQVDPPANAVDPIGGGGGACSLDTTRHGLFANYAAGSRDRGPVTLDFVAEASAVTDHVELELSDGRTLPVTLRDGWMGGWFGPEQVPPHTTATLVAFDADGHELARFQVADGRPQPPAARQEPSASGSASASSPMSRSR